MTEAHRAPPDEAHLLHLHVREALAHLVKAALVSDDAHADAWEKQAAVHLQRARIVQAAGGQAHLNMDGIWYQAVGDAEADTVVRQTETANPVLAQRCPFPLDELLSPSFNPVTATDRIRENSASG